MPGPEYTLSPGETKEVVNREEAQELKQRNDKRDSDTDRLSYEFTVDGGEVRLAHRESRVTGGRDYPNNFRGQLFPRGEAVYAYAPTSNGGDVTLSVQLHTFKMLGEAQPESSITNISDTVDVSDRAGRVVGEVADYTGSTVPTEQQTPVGVEDSGGVQVDPLGSGDQPLDVSGATVPTEQQTPVGVEDSNGTQVDPRQQPTYDATYSSVDVSASGTTTIYDPSTEAEATVRVEASGGTAAYEIQITDGTTTVTLDDPSAGNPGETDGLRLNTDDSLQVEVTNTGSGTVDAVVMYEEY